MKYFFNKISFKIGILFTIVFLILLLLLGAVLYLLFTQMFIDYITYDLLIRGNNHASVLSDNFNDVTIMHVGLMEQNVVTSVIVTDFNNNILTSSDSVDLEMKKYLEVDNFTSSQVLNKDWKDYQYITTVSPIDDNLGYVYMFYPTSVIKETVLMLKVFIGLASLGVILIAIGVIILLSKKMARPLIYMKDATNRIAKGEYKQDLNIKGEDEVSQLANSIQLLGNQLQYYEDTRNEFLASVSHELRTPLTYINGYSDILAKGIINDAEEQKKFLTIINDETKRVTRLVNDLFELSTVRIGKLTLNKEIVNINLILKKVVNNLSPFAKQKGIILNFNGVNEINLNIDPVRMEQVFFNLVENSIKYTDTGKVCVKILEKRDLIKIVISDTGIGISENELPRIWERFYRVDKSRARQTGGAGLGLNLVKEIIMLHKGEIDIKSTKGEGTTVYITLRRDGLDE